MVLLPVAGGPPGPGGIDPDQTTQRLRSFTLSVMQALYYTLAAVALYFVSDWLLQQMEIRRGERFEHRTLIFFAIITTLALVTFALIRHLTQAA